MDNEFDNIDMIYPPTMKTRNELYHTPPVRHVEGLTG
jgi:hypothetical protein